MRSSPISPLARASALALRLPLVLLPILVVLSWSRPAHAYAWMIRHGYGGCNVCHADPSGGELLTAYGRAQGDLLLRMHYGKDDSSAAASTTDTSGASFDSFDSFDEDDGGGAAAPKAHEEKPKAEAKSEGDDGVAKSAAFMWGLFPTPDFLLLGGSYRHVVVANAGGVRTFPMQADLYGQLSLGRLRFGGSIGASRVANNSPHARAAQVTTANDGNQWNLLSRTHWVGVDLGGQRQVTVRAGRLNLPFGLRIPEHIMWVRDATRTDRESDQSHGLAVAYNGEKLRGEVMGLAGNYQINPDKYRERGYSMFMEYRVSTPLAVGVSSLLTFAKADAITREQDSTTRGAHGAFARIVISEPLVLLAEGDVLHLSRHTIGYTGLAQLDWELVQGLHLMPAAEVLDAGHRTTPPGPGLPELDKVPGAGQPGFGGWLSADWFFLPHLEARVDAIGRQNGGMFMVQLHAYL